jgi:hypothetical protein
MARTYVLLLLAEKAAITLPGISGLQKFTERPQLPVYKIASS